MYISDEQFSRFRPQFRRVVAEWQARVPWIQAVAITEKLVGGEPAGEDAIVFYVGDKVAEDRLDEFEFFPKSIRIPGTDIVLPTDVVATPPFRFLTGPSCSSTRPAHGGDCIGPLGTTSIGTLGAVLKRKADGAPFILTASHAVLNIGGTLPAGQEICHPPGSATIGKVERTVLWTTINIMPTDAALVEVTVSTDAEPNINGLPPITGTGAPVLSQPVHFRGVYGVKSGIVACTVKVIVTIDLFKFDNTFFIIDANTEPGDSGAVVVNNAGEVLGVIFATNGLLTCCSFIDAVAKELSLSDFDF
jgi:hypothetical protein